MTWRFQKKSWERFFDLQQRLVSEKLRLMPKLCSFQRKKIIRIHEQNGSSFPTAPKLFVEAPFAVGRRRVFGAENTNSGQSRHFSVANRKKRNS